MIKIQQTVVGRDGNCLAACVASILEIPIQETPLCIHPPLDANLNADQNHEHWFMGFNAWLQGFGLRAVVSLMGHRADRPQYVWGIASCRIEETKSIHCVVMYNDDVAWDPSPIPYDRAILVPSMWMMFVATDPQDLVRQSKKNSMMFHQ